MFYGYFPFLFYTLISLFKTGGINYRTYTYKRTDKHFVSLKSCWARGIKKPNW